jgi:small subunit ribosomal protein S1
VKKDFLEVELDSGLKAIIKRLDISNNKHDQKTEKYEVGDRIEAKVMLFNKVSGKLLLSIKDMESDERESHFYSEENSGTSIGSIAGDVLGSLSVGDKKE